MGLSLFAPKGHVGKSGGTLSHITDRPVDNCDENHYILSFAICGPLATGAAVGEPHDDRSPMAVAMEWSARVTTISLEIVIPAAIGYWLDRRWGTEPVFVVVGAILGLVAFTYNFVKLAQSLAKRPNDGNQGDQERPHDGAQQKNE